MVQTLPALSVALVAACTTVAGCGKGGEKQYPVSGTVTVDGKGGDGVLLLFHPEKTTGDVGAATSDANGKYNAVYKTKPGLPAGKYKVTASWPDPAKRNIPVSMGATPDIPDLLRSRYAIRDRSEITVEVSASTKDLPPIELTTK